jgi:hypothetical protein
VDASGVCSGGCISSGSSGRAVKRGNAQARAIQVGMPVVFAVGGASVVGAVVERSRGAMHKHVPYRWE